MIFSLQLLAAFLLDTVLGDPRWYPHPVRLIGRICGWCERLTRTLFANLYLAGFVTVVLVVSVTVSITSVILLLAAALSPFWGAFVAILVLYTTIAARDLVEHSNEVHSQLAAGSLEGARAAVAQIVGRDTASLDKVGVCKACIETVAENMIDGIVAPFFFAILASLCAPFIGLSPIGCAAIGAIFYKAINTMDSMIAYKNPQYLQFGWTAAKVDDLVNFIPARIGGLCLIVAAFFLKLDYRRTAKIFLRDRLAHASPNAGHPEAAVAGALGIRLGGPAWYFGSLIEKPYIGDPNRQPVPEDIKKANTLVLTGVVIFVAAFLAGRMVIG